MPTSALLPHGAREERAANLDRALRYFARHYRVPSPGMELLRAHLFQIPADVAARELRLLCGVLHAPALLDDGRQAMDDYIASARRQGKLSKETARAWRQQLRRAGHLTIAPRGRPSWPYRQLERIYALAILDALPGRDSFPISSRDNRYSGPALRLLVAALNHALPATGAGADDRRVKLLRALRRRGRNVELVR